MHWRDIIRRPVITEKTNNLASDYNQYTFVVHAQASKPQIKVAIETAWNVRVDKIRVANMPAKRARRWRRVTVRKPAWKKAVVTLVAGSTIDLFEGV
ncbi:MAG: 50S ribosomal protein L23 [Chloroflexi bacterium]|nr:50S ribosomal protein L23 [Chloroflexota bacterium]MBP8058661.1 50S ribosomal protein L23 [Chloroflexota bacterium]